MQGAQGNTSRLHTHIRVQAKELIHPKTRALIGRWCERVLIIPKTQRVCTIISGTRTNSATSSTNCNQAWTTNARSRYAAQKSRLLSEKNLHATQDDLDILCVYPDTGGEFQLQELNQIEVVETLRDRRRKRMAKGEGKDATVVQKPKGVSKKAAADGKGKKKKK